MKNFSAAILVLLAADQANVANGYIGWKRFFRGATQRALTLSQQCQDETEDLFVSSSTEMNAAVDAINEEIGEKATCSEVDATSSACVVEFSTFDSAAAFTQACQDLGGKTVEVNARIDCNAATSEQRSGLGSATSFSYYGVLDCVSAECNDGSVRDKLEGTFAETAEQLQRSLGATCEHVMTSFAVTDSSGDATITVEEGTTVATPDGETTEEEHSEGDGHDHTEEEHYEGDGHDHGEEHTDEEDLESDAAESGSSRVSSLQCRSLITMTAAIPFLNMALAA